MSDTIQCLEHDGWFEITLNRPDQLNSFTDEMHLALRACLQKAHRHFCACGIVDRCGRVDFVRARIWAIATPRKWRGHRTSAQLCAPFMPRS